MNTNSLGGRIAFARERAGLSTAQLARRVGVKTRTLANWEREETVPRTNRLVMLAQFLNISPAWLLEGEVGYAPQAVRPGIAQIKERLEQVHGAIQGLSNLVEDLEQLIEDALRDEEHRRDVA
jgi:transcriptional regulator with XRE-family HTH domain